MISTKIPVTVDGEPLTFYNTPAQNQVFNDPTEQFIVLHKGRRLGATQGCANRITKALFKGNCLWIDTIQANLDTYWNMYFLPMFKNMHNRYWKYHVQSHDLKLFSNTCYFRSAERSENIEGLGARINTIVMNEAGHILKGSKGRNLWYNTIYPMILDCNPTVYIVGTPKGKRAKKGEKLSDGGRAEWCLFYEFAQKGYDPLFPTWKSFNFSSYDNPLIPRQNIEAMESDVPAIIRKQEIFGEFIDVSTESVFKPEWWQFVDELPPVVNRQRMILSIDSAFKIGEENDFSGFSIFLEHRSGFVWVYAIALKLEFPQLIQKTIDLYNEFNPDLVLIEDKASGQSLIQTLRQNVPFPVAGYKPDRDKYSRAVAITPFFQNGKVSILRGSWNRAALDQLEEFNASLDSDNDIVDSVTQLLNFAKGSSTTVKPVILKNRVSKRFKTHALMQGY